MAHVKAVNASLEGPLTDDAIARLYERIMDEAQADPAPRRRANQTEAEPKTES